MFFYALLAPPGIDGERAVEIARQFMREAGYAEGVVLDKLVPFSRKLLSDWQVVFDVEGDRASLHIDGDGTVQSMSYFRRRPFSKELTKAQTMEAIRALAQRQAPAFRFRADPNELGNLDALVGDRTFLNSQPRWGLRMEFRAGRLSYFRRSLDLPKIGAIEPRVSPSDAEKAFREYALSTESDRSARSLQPDRPGGPDRLVVDLGYYKFTSEATARLVYRGRAFNAPESNPDSLNILIDAVTGEKIAPDNGLL
jgi:hypothetical protein